MHILKKICESLLLNFQAKFFICLFEDGVLKRQKTVQKCPFLINVVAGL